jgi:AcrR family transcriptional regulator
MTQPEPSIRGVGRPRSEEVRTAILRAAGELLLEMGVQGFTIEGVAKRSGASKVTIYKWWTSKGALALDAFYASAAPAINTNQTGDVEADLITQVAAIVHLFRDTAVGPVLAGLIAEAQSDAGLAVSLRERWLEPRRQQGAKILEAGRTRGELRPDFDTTLILDQIYGAIYIRLLIGHAPLVEGIAQELVGNVLPGIRTSPAKRPASAIKKSRDRNPGKSHVLQTPGAMK